MYKDNQERIDAYLRGEISQADRNKFESNLKTNISLYNDFIETKAILKAIADRKKKFDMMKQWDAEELRLRIFNRGRIIRRWTIGLGAVAACIAIGFFAIRPIFLTTLSSPTSTFVMPDFRNEAYYRSSNNSMEYLDSLISSKDYKTALAYADSLILDYSIELKQYEGKDTLTEKEEYSKEIGEDTLDDLEWRRANLLIALDKKFEAKECLKHILEANGMFKEQADSLIRTLNKI